VFSTQWQVLQLQCPVCVSSMQTDLKALACCRVGVQPVSMFPDTDTAVFGRVLNCFELFSWTAS
jgi:hypothetical protein